MEMRNQETEVKIKIAGLDAARKRLRKLGFTLLHRRSLEDNVLFDTPNRTLRHSRSLLRLRRYGSRWWLTYKGTPLPDPHYKSRLELEIGIQEPQGVGSILEALGFQPVFRYQKYRSQYGETGNQRGRDRHKKRIEVSLDETPIGNFLELEGTRTAIDRAAQLLGYSRGDYLTVSYGALYLEECRKQNVPPGDMIFVSPAQRETEKLDRAVANTRKFLDKRTGKTLLRRRGRKCRS